MNSYPRFSLSENLQYDVFTGQTSKQRAVHAQRGDDHVPFWFGTCRSILGNHFPVPLVHRLHGYRRSCTHLTECQSNIVSRYCMFGNRTNSDMPQTPTFMSRSRQPRYNLEEEHSSKFLLTLTRARMAEKTDRADQQ